MSEQALVCKPGLRDRMFNHMVWRPKNLSVKLRTSSGLALLALFGIVNAVRAQAQKPIDALKGAGGAAGFSTSGEANPAVIIGNIVGYALGLLGIVFVVLTIYAGYLWMTAQGNEEQITKAKKMITNAVIGIIIISLAYVITSFVMTNVQTASTATEAPPPETP